MHPVWFGKVENGRLVLFDKDKFAHYLSNFDGKDVQLVLSEPRNERTNKQNRYYWGVILPLIADTTGHDAEEIHTILKLKFLGRQVDLNGAMYRTSKSTTRLSIDEFSTYIEKIKAWGGAELGIHFPEPGEVTT